MRMPLLQVRIRAYVSLYLWFRFMYLVPACLLPARLLACMSVCEYVCLFSCLSIHLSVCPSTHRLKLPLHLSVCSCPLACLPACLLACRPTVRLSPDFDGRVSVGLVAEWGLQHRVWEQPMESVNDFKARLSAIQVYTNFCGGACVCARTYYTVPACVSAPSNCHLKKEDATKLNALRRSQSSQADDEDPNCRTARATHHLPPPCPGRIRVKCVVTRQTLSLIVYFYRVGSLHTACASTTCACVYVCV